MTVKEFNKSVYCKTCKSRLKYIIDYEDTCDWCGEKKTFVNQKYSHTIQVTVYPSTLDAHKTLNVTFCSHECMIQWVANYNKSFGFMTLPYIGKEAAYINQQFLKKLIAGKIKWRKKKIVKR